MRPSAAKKITSFMKVNFANILQLPKSSGLAKFFGYVLQMVSRLHFTCLNSIFTVFAGRRRITFLFFCLSSLSCFMHHSGLTNRSILTGGHARYGWGFRNSIFPKTLVVCARKLAGISPAN